MTVWIEGDVIANKLCLHTYRGGPETAAPGRTIVLCHGYAGYGLAWSDVADALVADYDVIMVDARYHGHSEVPREDSADSMPHDLGQFVAAMGLDRPVAVGHSMGASATFRAAALYPKAFRAIALEDPVWIDNPANRPSQDRHAQMARYKNTPLDQLRREYRVEHPTWSEADILEETQAKVYLSPEVLNRGHGRAPWRETLAKVRCPILLLTGNPELGAIVTPAIAQEAVGLHPDLTVAYTPDAGHPIRHDNLTSFLAALKPYLARVFG